MLRKTRLDLPTDAETQFSNEADAISIGVACWSSEIINTSDFLRQVDEHLYPAKTGGRNRIC